jgi:phospholipase/lecithinase/hemolysin
MIKVLARLITISMAFAATSTFADSDFSDLVVFGDSLSDPGNRFVLEGQVSVRPYDAGNIPDGPYPIGRGKTFSNGPTWSQVLAKELHLQGGTGPALRTTRFTNYAYGGARAASSAEGPFNMTAQVGQFLDDNAYDADPDALYAVWFGGNDVRDALTAFVSGGGFPAAQAVIADAIQTYMFNMTTLYFAGATEFLVSNMPNLGAAPAVTAQGPGASALAMGLSAAFNAALEDALQGFETALPVNITRLDAFSLINDVVANPEDFGLSNATDACVTPEVLVGAICKKPDGYLFWDGVHPTRATHEIIADLALDVLD